MFLEYQYAFNNINDLIYGVIGVRVNQFHAVQLQIFQVHLRSPFFNILFLTTEAQRHREILFYHERHEKTRKKTNTFHHEEHEVNEEKFFILNKNFNFFMFFMVKRFFLS